MQICPQCQHSNPASQESCDRCETSLTHKRCHECGSEVELIAESCGSCGTQTGAIWWAAIAGGTLTPIATADDGTEDSSPTLFLDPERRYRLLEPKVGQPLHQAAVHDVQPLAPVPLEEKIAQGDLLSWLELYLHIVQECEPALPSVHNAWETPEGQRVILFKDRSQWPTLSAQLAAEPPQPLQILSWMAAAIALWEPLAQAGCAQSLLEASNLRIDEDRVLGLQQLYEDRPGEIPTLTTLGVLWQQLFANYLQESPQLAQLLQDTAAGEVAHLDDLYERLEAIAYEQEGGGGVALLEEDLESLDDDENEEEATIVLPMQLQSVDCIGLTDVGRKRHHNEDFFFVRTELSKQDSPATGSRVTGSGLYIVCDGMGGHAAGEVASEMASETLQQYLDERCPNGSPPDEEILRNGIFATNDTLFQANQEKARSGLGRMGTTLVMAVVRGTQVAIAHVGDSRAYKITRRGGLEQITVDHEVGQRHIQRGLDPEVAYAQPDAYQLTQAIGPRDNTMIAPDVQFLDVDEDTLLLLCSDGLSDNDLLEENYETYLVPLISSKANLRQGMEELIAFANQYNGHDNITGVLVRIKVAPAIGT